MMKDAPIIEFNVLFSFIYTLNVTLIMMEQPHFHLHFLSNLNVAISSSPPLLLDGGTFHQP